MSELAGPEPEQAAGPVITAQDTAIIAAQLGRPPRGLLAVLIGARAGCPTWPRRRRGCRTAARSPRCTT